MNVFDTIRGWFINARDFFIWLAIESYSAFYIPNAIGDLFNSLSTFCHNVAVYLWDVARWYDDVTSKIANLLTYSNIYSYFKSYFDYAINAWNWITNAWSNVTDIINIWWSTSKLTVQSWIDTAISGAQGLVGQLEAWVSNLQSAWDDFKSMIPSISEILAWFANWWGKILANIISWGALTGLEIQALINTATKEILTPAQPLIDLKDSIVEFFVDPEDWLYKAVDRIFERFW